MLQEYISKNQVQDINISLFTKYGIILYFENIFKIIKRQKNALWITAELFILRYDPQFVEISIYQRLNIKGNK